MIATQMRSYNYSRISNVNDDYGQPTVIEEAGTIKIAINFTNETISENTLYSGAQYVGLTLNKNVDDSYIIQYEEEKLKVLYVNAKGKYTQVFMARM